jgi:hypothetical protein
VPNPAAINHDTNCFKLGRIIRILLPLSGDNFFRHLPLYSNLFKVTGLIGYIMTLHWFKPTTNVWVVKVCFTSLIYISRIHEEIWRSAVVKKGCECRSYEIQGRVQFLE